jgi:hypothetical protein
MGTKCSTELATAASRRAHVSAQETIDGQYSVRCVYLSARRRPAAMAIVVSSTCPQTSPTACTPDTTVFWYASTAMCPPLVRPPLDALIPAAARFNDPVLGTRPVASRTLIRYRTDTATLCITAHSGECSSLHLFKMAVLAAVFHKQRERSVMRALFDLGHAALRVMHNPLSLHFLLQCVHDC